MYIVVYLEGSRSTAWCSPGPLPSSAGWWQTDQELGRGSGWIPL